MTRDVWTASGFRTFDGPPPDPCLEGHWRPTGTVRLRVGRLGNVRLEEEIEAFFCTRRAGEGYSPGQWEVYRRWRRVERGRVMMLANAPKETTP